MIFDLDTNWMIGLTSLEAYNSIFIITVENNRNEPHTDNFDEFSFPKLNDELEDSLGIAYNKPTYLKHDLIGPRIIQAFKILRSEKS